MGAVRRTFRTARVFDPISASRNHSGACAFRRVLPVSVHWLRDGRLRGRRPDVGVCASPSSRHRDPKLREEPPSRSREDDPGNGPGCGEVRGSDSVGSWPEDRRSSRSRASWHRALIGLRPHKDRRASSRCWRRRSVRGAGSPRPSSSAHRRTEGGRTSWHAR